MTLIGGRKKDRVAFGEQQKKEWEQVSCELESECNFNQWN
jgi:hypothetical protein